MDLERSVAGTAGSAGAAAGAAEAGASGLDRLERAEFRALLRRQMESLSEVERDLIALKFTDGLSNVQVAEMLGLSPNRMGVMLHRALGRLREAMRKEVGDGIP
jgi:RNA polymerase sigma factor (sigma-70 family)